MKRRAIYSTLIALAVYILFFLPLKTIRSEEISTDGKYKAEISLRYYNLSPNHITLCVYELSGNKWNAILTEKKEPSSKSIAMVGAEWIEDEKGKATVQFHSLSADLTKSIEKKFQPVN